MTASPSKLNIECVSSDRIFAPSRPGSPQDAPLSIIDATVSSFAASEVILLYDAVSDESNANPPSVGQLQESLRITLGAYPQWCGRLRLSDYDSGSTDHLKRYGRCLLTYGGEDEPGVEFVVAKTGENLASLVPTAGERAKSKTWDATEFPGRELVPATALSSHDLTNPQAPSLIVQLTTFGCGGHAIALKMSHPLADAHCLSYFARDWAAVTRALIANEPTPALTPLFDPQRLDKAAAGDIDAASPDPAILARARSLPCHRFDWWISGDDCPYPTNSTKVPEALKSQPHDPPGTRLPWAEWNLAASIKHCVLHFSGAEISAMQAAARTIEPRVSKQDAIVAHVWNRVNQARGLVEDDEQVYLDYTLGLRGRTRPPLGERFVGSPIMLTAISGKGRQVAHPDGLSNVASMVRRTVELFTPEAVAAHLHDKCYDQSPTRIWQAFLGKRNLLATSWIHTKMYEVDVGFGAPRYVEAVMPKMDGLFQLMEAKPSSTAVGEKRGWSDDGIDCQLHLETQTMENLLKDPLLRRFA
jgi:hypothetical protein